MPDIVTDLEKIVTDELLLRRLAEQGIDKNYVELWHDYAPSSKGKEYSPYAKFYRDLKSNKRFMVVSGLPMVKVMGKKIEAGWLWSKGKYYSKANLFSAVVQGKKVQLTCLSQSTEMVKGEQTTWEPQVFLDGVEQTCGEAILLETDPENRFYSRNVLEWDYGICKRRIRIIEGRFFERWVFLANPNGDVRIKHNFADKGLRLGYIRDATYWCSRLEITVSDDEESVSRITFGQAVYPLEIGASGTFYSDVTAVDGMVRQDYGGVGNGVAFATGLAAPGSHAYYSEPAINAAGWYSDTGVYTWDIFIRSIYMFPTSGLPDNCVKSSATLAFFSNFKSDPEGDLPNVNIYEPHPASTNQLVGADYERGDGKFESTPLCDTPITYNDWKTGDPGDPNEFTLNQDGLDAISKTGVTKLGIRNANYDVAIGSPTWTGNDHYTRVNSWCYSKGAGYKPKLVVTYYVVPRHGFVNFQDPGIV